MDTLIHWLKGLHLTPPRKQAGVGIHGQGQWAGTQGRAKVQLCCFGGTSFFKEGELWREMGQPT